MLTEILIPILCFLAFGAGYYLRDVLARQEASKTEKVLDLHMGLTAQRLGYEPTTVPYAKPQNSIDDPKGEKKGEQKGEEFDQGVVHQTYPDLYQRRNEAFVKEAKETARKEAGWNASGVLQ